MGRYYDETSMTGTRVSFEAHVLPWDGVTMQRMFGCPSYLVDGKLFAFLVTDGVVLTALPPDVVESLPKGTAHFDSGTRTMRGWPQLPLVGSAGVGSILPMVERSYQGARAQAAAEQG